MTKMTSAYANKVLKKLNEDKEFWLNKERTSNTYVAAEGEEPVIPEYDYVEISNTIDEIDAKITKIKHAINYVNVTSQIQVGDAVMSADTILIRMAQLNKRKDTLDFMRKQLPKSRMESAYFTRKNAIVEYKYVNYDLELVKAEYESIDSEIAAMQLALDKFNQTFEFEVEI